jgi:4-diphosphocytidyl-2-C-methyl-D-erythritol kinase
MIAFPNCKINLGLHITRKRQDGYHDLETVFYPLPLKDALEITAQQPGAEIPEQQEGLSFTAGGLTVAGDAANNLCVKAWRLLKNDFPQLPPVQLHLHKAIPMGAGLGGGSSDAAFTLRLINDRFKLGISTEKLLDYSLQLGSDCPFFIINKPCIATGRGELLQPIHLDLSPYTFLLVYPGIHINTGWAFSQIRPDMPAQSMLAIIQQPVSTWKDVLVNDFEAPVCKLHPELQHIKDTLYAAGALYASMTGSGSSFYGLFPKEKVPEGLFPAHLSYVMNG